MRTLWQLLLHSTIAGAEVLTAPVRCCIQETCPERGLPLGGNRKEFPGTLFSNARGVLPIRIMTLYCRGTLNHFFLEAWPLQFILHQAATPRTVQTTTSPMPTPRAQFVDTTEESRRTSRLRCTRTLTSGWYNCSAIKWPLRSEWTGLESHGTRSLMFWIARRQMRA